MSIKVMLADDHVLMREGLRQLLELDGNIEVISEANDGEECLQKINFMRPQMLLLDINMPKINGIEVLEEIKKKKIDIKVLILTVHTEIEYLIKALDTKVDGYLLKDSEFAELKRAINAVANGEKYIQPKLISLLNNRFVTRDKDKKNIAFLTNRELEILVQVANGMLNKEIASSLNITERTVKNHVSNIFKKIGVSDRTQAAVFAIKNNIINLS